MNLTVNSWLLFVITTFIVVFENLILANKSDHIRLNVYFEPQDEESTRLLRDELLPLIQDPVFSEQIKLKLVPFGHSRCNPDHHEYLCTCPRGEDECDLMYLMACILHDYRHHEDALELIFCIQDRSTLNETNRQCLHKLPKNEATWLLRCSRIFRGRYLSWINSLRTKALSANLTDFPVVTLNGKVKLKTSELREQILEHLEDRNG